MKMGMVDMVEYDGEKVKDFFILVSVVFKDFIYVVIYVVSMIVIVFYLWYGF